MNLKQVKIPLEGYNQFVNCYKATDDQFLAYFVKKLKRLVAASNRLEIRKKMLEILEKEGK